MMNDSARAAFCFCVDAKAFCILPYLEGQHRNFYKGGGVTSTGSPFMAASSPFCTSSRQFFPQTHFTASAPHGTLTLFGVRKQFFPPMHFHGCSQLSSIHDSVSPAPRTHSDKCSPLGIPPLVGISLRRNAPV